MLILLSEYYVLKKGELRSTDYEKIKHICDERIRQIKIETKHQADSIDFEIVE